MENELSSKTQPLAATPTKSAKVQIGSTNGALVIIFSKIERLNFFIVSLAMSISLAVFGSESKDNRKHQKFPCS